LNPEDETDGLSRNVGKNNHYLMRNNAEEGSSQNKGSWTVRQSEESQQSLANIG